MTAKLDLEQVLNPKELSLYGAQLNQNNHVSHYHSRDGIAVLTLRELVISDEALSTIAKHFIIKDHKMYLYDANEKKLCELKRKFHELGEIINDAQKVSTEVLNAYYEEVDLMEDYIYEREVPRHFMDMWFDLKKNILKIERFYTRYMVVMKDFIINHEVDESFDQSSYNQFLEHITFNLSQSAAFISRLDTIFHYYSSVKNDRLNKNIYFLTLVSGVFLPLNLIVGFFGMNTENLFFKDNPNGTFMVVYILLGLIFTLTVGFKLARIFDNLFVKTGFGNFKFYKTISKNIQKIEKVFEID